MTKTIRTTFYIDTPEGEDLKLAPMNCPSVLHIMSVEYVTDDDGHKIAKAGPLLAEVWKLREENAKLRAVAEAAANLRRTSEYASAEYWEAALAWLDAALDAALDNAMPGWREEKP